MVSRLCDDGVQGRDGRCVENSSCFQIFLFVPVCILLLGSPAGLICFPLLFTCLPVLFICLPGWVLLFGFPAGLSPTSFYLSPLLPSSGLLCPPLPCNPLLGCCCCVRLCLAILYMCPRKPLHLSPSRLHICLPVSTFVSQLWTAVAASALQSFVSQLWTSQAAECSDSKNTNCLGSTVV